MAIDIGDRALTYLYTLAAISVTFVGFSALVIILRQTLGGEMSKLDILITRIFIQLGFLVAAGALLPALLALLQFTDLQCWRLASVAIAVPSLLFACSYPSRRRAASGSPTPIGVWLDVIIIVVLSLMLFLNGVGGFNSRNPGVFAFALTGILFVAGWAYLQALNTLLRRHREESDGRAAQ
jgi:hypothetical protein